MDFLNHNRSHGDNGFYTPGQTSREGFAPEFNYGQRPFAVWAAWKLFDETVHVLRRARTEFGFQIGLPQWGEMRFPYNQYKFLTSNCDDQFPDRRTPIRMRSAGKSNRVLEVEQRSSLVCATYTASAPTT